MPSAFERERAQLAEGLWPAVRAKQGADATAEAAGAAVRAALGADADATLTAKQLETVTHCLRWMLDRAVAAATEAGGSVMRHDGGAVPSLLDAAACMGERGLCETAAVFYLLEDLFELVTIAECDEAFAWLEAHAEALSRPAFFSRGKFVVLRTCNDLLRRLSKSPGSEGATAFAGRTVMLLAQLYPISERSALNLKGVYNKDNPTAAAAAAAVSAAAAPAKAAAGEAGGEATAAGDEDRKFHAQFWGLQQFFADPPSAVSTPQKFVELVAGLSAVLSAMEAKPIDAGSVAAGAQQEQQQEQRQDQEEQAAAADMGRYLTSPTLLHLQMRDATFRRHILVQALVLCRFLQSPAAQPPLRPKQRERMAEVEARCEAALAATPPRGAEFAAAVKQTLAREAAWSDWKKAGCPPLERKPDAAGPGAGGGGDDGGAPAPAKRRRVAKGKGGGASVFALDELWTSPLSGHEAFLTGGARRPAPSLEEILEPLAEQMDPEAGIDDEYKLKNDKGYCWKVLRLLSRQSLADFNKAATEGLEAIAPLHSPAAAAYAAAAAEAAKAKEAEKEAAAKGKEEAKEGGKDEGEGEGKDDGQAKAEGEAGDKMEVDGAGDKGE